MELAKREVDSDNYIILGLESPLVGHLSIEEQAQIDRFRQELDEPAQYTNSPYSLYAQFPFNIERPVRQVPQI